MANSKAQAVVFGGLVGVLVGVFWMVLSRPKARSLPQPKSAALSQQIDIDVYLDGSGSMKNFLQLDRKSADGDNYLREFLDDCEDTLHDPATTGGWVDHLVRFWRFGASVSPIPDKGGLRQLALHPDGYPVSGQSKVPGFTESRTSIELPINHRPQDAVKTSHPEVKVIITDLYQSNGANVRPAEGLADQYLTDAGAVAIYGIRNPYSTDAPVEDLPALNGASLPKGAADTMPFYIIVAGDNAADVYHAQETLMRGPTGRTLKNAFDHQRAFVVYLAKDPGWRLGSTGGHDDRSVQVSWVDANDTHKRIGAGDFDAELYKPVGLLRIRDGNGRVTFATQGAGQTLGSALMTTPISEAPSVRTKAYVGGAHGERIEDKSAEGAVTATPCNGGATICATFNKRHLASGNVPYLFEFDLIGDRDNGTLGSGSDFMKTWNIEDAEEREIMGEGTHAAFPSIRNIGGQHPGRTPRLAEFMQVLQGRLFQVKSVETDPVRIATYDLYVEAR